MDKVIAMVIVALGIALMMFLLPITYTFVGAFSGWVVAWAFDDSWTAVTEQIGWQLNGWQTGAFLGFVGAFFKARLTTTNTKS